MRVRWTMAVPVALAVIAGCRDRTPKSVATAPAAIATKVEVITDAAQVRAARDAWAKSREDTLAALLADPGNINTFDSESSELLRAQRDRSLQALTRARDDTTQPTATRVRAVAALKELGVAPDPVQLTALATSDEATFEVVWNVDRIYRRGETLPPELRALIVRAAGSDHANAAREAARLAAVHGITEAADAVVRRAADPVAHGTILGAAAKLRPTAEVLDILLTRLEKRSDDHDSVITSVAQLADANRDPVVKLRAADACFQYLKRLPDAPFIDGAMTGALHTVATAIPPDAAGPMLADLVRTTSHKYVRQYALAELNKLDPQSAARVSRETKVEMPEPEPQEPESDLSPQLAATICVRHKLLTQAEADAALKAMAPSPATRSAEANADPGDDHPPGPRGLLYAAKRYTAFDVETGMSPNRHDLLIMELAEACAGEFKPEAVLEEYVERNPAPQADKGVVVAVPDSDVGDYTVQFIHGGRLYRFHPQDLGDWYDLDAVLAAVNRALADAGAPRRLVPLASDGQIAELVFGDPPAVQAAAPELGLTLGTDPDDARKQGKAFEDEVFRKLEGR